MKHPEEQYLELLRALVETGDERIDRTGVGTKALFGCTMRFDLNEGFPAFTTKKVFWKTAFKEMLWMLSGGRNLRELLQQNVKIWTDWPLKKYRKSTGHEISESEFESRILADESFAQQWGDLGPVYGYQWRHWRNYDGGEIDQIRNVIEGLKNNPGSRRLLWEGWNVAEIEQMALPPCHKTYQFFVSSDKKLSCALVQRSADIMLGVPFNIVNSALVTHLLAEECGYQVGNLTWFGCDVHLYLNHIEQAQLQLTRSPKAWPRLRIKTKRNSIFEYEAEDFDLLGYDPHPHIAAQVAV